MDPIMNQTNKNQVPQESSHPGSTHSAPPPSLDLSCLTHPTIEPQQDALQTSAKTTAESSPSKGEPHAQKLDPQTPKASRVDPFEVPFDRVGFSSLLAEIKESPLLGKMGRIALGAIPMIGVVAGSAAEIAGYVSMSCGFVMGLASRGIDVPPISSELFFGGVLGIVAGSAMAHVADKGCHMVRRVFGNTESHAEAVERAGRHTSSLIEYLINKLNR